MELIDRGHGATLILIPGIQGRWEWMSSAVDALATQYRVLTFSLAVASGPRLFDQWLQQIDRLVDHSGADTVTLVGVSFGGLVAANYAATRAGRVTRLVLVSAPSPSFTLNPRLQLYLRYPRLAFPLFGLGSVPRLWPEFRAGRPALTGTLSAAMRQLWRVGRFPASPRLMAECVREWKATDLSSRFRRITAPTLVLTGEPDLDRVVPVSNSLEYLKLIAGAEHQTFPGAGHLGFILHPNAFATLVSDFIRRPDARDSRPTPAAETTAPCT